MLKDRMLLSFQNEINHKTMRFYKIYTFIYAGAGRIIGVSSRGWFISPVPVKR